MNLSGVYKSFLERWDGLQTCWIVSDTHFGDEVIAGEPNRPSDEELFQSFIKTMWHALKRIPILMVNFSSRNLLNVFFTWTSEEKFSAGISFAWC